MILYECEIRHVRSAPLRNVFRYPGYLWLVDVDHLPRIPLLTVFRARDHLGDPRASIRENLDRFLAPGGRIGLQTITMAHDRMLATRHTYTWIHKYIFPGGLLPSVTAIQDSLARTTLRITGREDVGAHYAETLRIWRERFGARADEVARLGFDEVFNRMWTFYLCYSEAGFRAGYIDVSQLTQARTSA